MADFRGEWALELQPKARAGPETNYQRLLAHYSLLLGQNLEAEVGIGRKWADFGGRITGFCG